MCFLKKKIFLTNLTSLLAASAGQSTPKKSRLTGGMASPANAKVNAAGSTSIHSTSRYSLTVKDDSKCLLI
jgi:hypothetical protein